jgi:hypothetical protein
MDMELAAAALGLTALGSAGAYICMIGLRRSVLRRRRQSWFSGWLIWFVISSALVAALFYYVDAEAGRAKTRNAGIPIFFVIVWFMCALFGPAVGYIVSGMRSMFRNKADG